MGQYSSNLSQLEKEIGSENFPANERYYGLVNFGNTCYCNSVLQALYFCKPFREKVLQYRLQSKKAKEESLLSILADLFHNTTSQKKRVGTIAPKKLIARVKKDNAAFDNFMQQDAHEFFNFLVNSLDDILQAESNASFPHPHSQSEMNGINNHNNNNDDNSNNHNNNSTKTRSQSDAPLMARGWHLPPSKSDSQQTTQVAASSAATSPSPRLPSTATSSLTTSSLTTKKPSAAAAAAASTASTNPSSTTMPPLIPTTMPTTMPTLMTMASRPPQLTWIHELFQGTLTNETRCLNCETVSSKDEDFLDLSVDVEANTSISHCLRVFSNTETLCADQKYHCEKCQSKQEAQKRMRVKKLPRILCLHLKRFKYMEDLQRYTKLSHRVVFAFELRLFNTSSDAEHPDKMFDLVAVVVHCGSGPNRGHYISLVRSHGFWLLFDDDIVERIETSTVQDFYGMASDDQKQSESGYILFYEARDP